MSLKYGVRDGRAAARARPCFDPIQKALRAAGPLGLIVEEDGGVRVAEVHRAATPRNWARRASATCCYP